MDQAKKIDRRGVLMATAATAAAAAAVPAVLGLTGTPAAATLPGEGGQPSTTDTGAGMYVDLSTALHLSPFNLNPVQVTCAVGSFGLGPLGLVGPFAMLMYSVGDISYDVNRTANTITSAGRMISVTMVTAGLIAEQVEHDFVAIGFDRKGVTADRFEMHYTTPAWAPGGILHALSTPSTAVPGFQMFGGNIAFGQASLLGPKVYLGGISVQPA